MDGEAPAFKTRRTKCTKCRWDVPGQHTTQDTGIHRNDCRTGEVAVVPSTSCRVCTAELSSMRRAVKGIDNVRVCIVGVESSSSVSVKTSTSSLTRLFGSESIRRRGSCTCCRWSSTARDSFKCAWFKLVSASSRSQFTASSWVLAMAHGRAEPLAGGCGDLATA